MNTCLPTAADVRQLMGKLSHAGMRGLAQRSGVPFTTLWKIRTGETKDPRLETVRVIWPELIGTEGAPTIPEEARDAA